MCNISVRDLSHEGDDQEYSDVKLTRYEQQCVKAVIEEHNKVIIHEYIIYTCIQYSTLTLSTI